VTSRLARRLFRFFVRVIALLVFAAVLLVGITAYRVWHVARIDDRRTSDVIVVLGASQFDGRPSEVFRFRLDHALTLYREHVAPRVVTVGGRQPGDRFTEAAAGARYLRGQGVPADALVPVSHGNDTLQSMEALAPVLAAHGWHTAVLVTDPWHELRSRKMATDQGIDAITSPTHSGPAVQTRGTEIRYIARETAAYLYYVFFHRSAENGPRAV
jgi:uncharacterized SAM-binding protein YcdF (DUF218 family)